MLKKRHLILTLLLTAICALFACCSKGKYKYDLAICAIFKNESPYLKEWIDYHHKILKVSHFYLYNNESTDNYKEVLQPYIAQGIVELIDWDSTEQHAMRDQITGAAWNDYQIGAYNDCMQSRAMNRARWVAAIDIDEFIVPTNGVKSFHKLLKRSAKPFSCIGTLQIYWKVFGTSNVWELDDNKLMIEQLYHRAKDNHGWNRRMVKSISRPEAVDVCLIHEAQLHRRYRSKKVAADLCSVHHYWAGTEKRFQDKRQPIFGQVQEQFNAVEDRTIFQYLDLMR